MKSTSRYLLTFIAATIAGVFLHELGHAVAGWIEGIAMVPTPAKEYILRSEVAWNQEIWIAFGGIVGTTLAVLIAIALFLRKPHPASEAILAGALVPLGFYTLRFLIAGRGHDGLEWQEAQAAIGLAPAGHLVDVFFLLLLGAGIIVWGIRMRPRLRHWLLKMPGLAIAGIILLIVLQVVNNLIFNRFFPDTTVDIPEGFEGIR
jgi:hypothetical protein